MPNLDQQSMKLLNLTVLQRIDPLIEEILITTAHVTFYEFNIDLSQWVRLSLSLSLSQFQNSSLSLIFLSSSFGSFSELSQWVRQYLYASRAKGLIYSRGMLSPPQVGLGPFSRFVEECDNVVAWFWGLLVDLLRLGLWLREA